jgi:hypothetical protein
MLGQADWFQTLSIPLLSFAATKRKIAKKSHRCQSGLLNSTAERIWPTERNRFYSGWLSPNSIRLEAFGFNPSDHASQRSSIPLPAIRSALEFYDPPQDAETGLRSLPCHARGIAKRRGFSRAGCSIPVKARLTTVVGQGLFAYFIIKDKVREDYSNLPVYRRSPLRK